MARKKTPLASPWLTLLLGALLVLLVVSFVVEGDGLFPSSTAQRPDAASASPAASPGQDAPAGLELHAIPVGKADCLLLKLDGKTMLVDAGNNGDEQIIFDYLDGQGVARLDVVVNTHPHEDHLGAMDKVILRYEVGQAYLSPKSHTTAHYEDLLLALDSRQVPTATPKPGDSFTLGGATITFLSPQPDADYGDEINDWSLVFLLQYGEKRFLFTGDAESPAENDLLDAGADLAADVLKVAHHGSNSSTKKKFLQAVGPTFALICCDDVEKPDAPAKKVLERLAEVGATVLRTDRNGPVIIRSDGHTLTVQGGESS